MKLFVILNSKDDKLNGEKFIIEDTSIKTMHKYPEFSDDELRIKSFDGILLKMSNSDNFIEARLLKKLQKGNYGKQHGCGGR